MKPVFSLSPFAVALLFLTASCASSSETGLYDVNDAKAADDGISVNTDKNDASVVRIICKAEDGKRFCRDEKGVPVTGMMNVWADGRLVAEVTLADGQREGPTRYYGKEGRLSYAIPYNAGLQDGVEVAFAPNGSVRWLTPYKQGKKDGYVLGFYDNGAFSSILYYSNDLEDGVYKKYYENGRVAIEHPYDAGKLINYWIEYYPNGQFKKTTPYKDGRADGVEIFYDEDGSIYQKRRFYSEDPYRADYVD